MPRAPRTYAPKSSKWAFVLNNPTESEKTRLMDFSNKVKFAVWQYEVGKSGTKHLQGCMVLKEHRNLEYVKKMISPRLHADIMKKSVEINERYCTKKKGFLEGPWQIGEPPESKQGKRSDLLDVQKKLDKQIPMQIIAKENFSSWTRYNKSFDKYQNMFIEDKDWKPQVFVLVGKTGIGKSWWASHNTNCGFAVWDEKWNDGYDGKDIIYNDFTGQLPYRKLLQLCDTGAFRLEGKGTTMKLRARRIVFTSNFPWITWYNWEKEKADPDAFKRRIDYHFDVSQTEPAMIPFFTDDWTKEHHFTNPYPIETIDWDAPIDVDDQDTWDVQDAAYSLEDLGPVVRKDNKPTKYNYCYEEHSDNSNDEYYAKILRYENKHQGCARKLESSNPERYDMTTFVTSEDEVVQGSEGFSSDNGEWL